MTGRRRTIIVLACCLGAGFGTLLDSAATTYAVPSLQQSLGATTQQVQWFLASYSLTFGLGLVPAGRLGDRLGRKGPLLFGLALFLGGGLLSVFAAQIWWSVAGRIVQGFGGGTISAQVLGLIQDEFEGMARLRALSGYGMASAASALAGPLLSALVLQTLPADWSWRVILGLNIPFITATLLVTLLYHPLPRDGELAQTTRRPGLDLPAVALLGALVTVITLPVVDPVLSDYSLWLLLVVPLLVAVLVWWERRCLAAGRLPLFVPALVRSRGFVIGCVVAMFWFGAILAKSTVLTLYLLEHAGLTPLWVAALFIPGALARIWASAQGTRAFSRFGAHAVPLALGVELAAAALLLVATLGTPSTARLIWVTVAFSVVSGLGSGITEPVLRAVTFAHAPAQARGVAASFFQLVQRLSATFFVALATGLLLAGGDLGLTFGVIAGGAGTLVAAVLSLDRIYRVQPAR